MSLKFIDLFAGIGGFRIALENQGLKCVFSSDNDKNCQDVYEHNFGEKPTGDITKIRAKDIPDFDILAAGFPCQPFSYAGNLKGFEDLTIGTLFFEVCRIIKEKKPKIIFLENVKGLKSHNEGETLKIIEKTLIKLGYTIYWKILNSKDFGVPQSRERWYCVGFKKNTTFEFPSGTEKNIVLRDIVEKNAKYENLKLTDFELKRIKKHFQNYKKVEGGRVNHDNSKYSPSSKKGKHGIYSYLKPDGTLRFHVGDYAKTQIQEAYYCNLNSIAPSIIATREPKLWDIERRLSLIECMRLQGFPKWFKFNVSNLQAKKQLGNAVTIPVIESITEKFLQSYKNSQRITPKRSAESKQKVLL